MPTYQNIFISETIEKYLTRYEIDRSDQQEILKRAYTIQIDKRSQIVLEQDKTNIIHIKDGLCSISISDLNGHSITLGLLPTGANLIMGGFLFNEYYNVEINALVSSHLSVISTDFSCPCYQVSIEAERILAKLSTQTIARFLYTETKKQSLSSFEIVEAVVSKFRKFEGVIRLSSEDLSKLTGCSRQQTCRVLNKLEKRGTIRRFYGGFQTLSTYHWTNTNQTLEDSFPILGAR